MFSRIKLFSKLRNIENSLLHCKESTDLSSGHSYSELFFSEKVQNLLKKLTHITMEKAFRRRGLGQPLTSKKYVLLTDEELKKELEIAEKKLEYVMQIPPVVTPREIPIKIIQENNALDGHDIHHAKFVFTDISQDTINEKRIIWVREPNGVLRTASKDERHRMNQLYFPIPGREIKIPRMFLDENFKFVLENEHYEFILDRACVQFDPDDSLYHKFIGLTYDRINEKFHFERILSTRHFGSLVFYLVSHKKIDNLLIHYIRSERIDDAYMLVELYHLILPDCSSAVECSKNENLDLLKEFIKLDANKRDELEMTLQTYIRMQEEKKKVEMGIKSAHGLQ